MSGSTPALINSSGNSTPISINLKRIMAKVSVRTTVSEDFIRNSGGGTVVITHTKLERITRNSALFPSAVKSGSYTTTSLEQTPGGSGSYDNLFYVCENGKLQEESKLQLTLTGYYDRDGNPSTTTDQMEVEYTVPIDGSGEGAILRNAYYRLDLSIKGLSGSDVIVGITVADWESPVTQNVDLGI